MCVLFVLERWCVRFEGTKKGWKHEISFPEYRINAFPTTLQRRRKLIERSEDVLQSLSR